MDEAVFTIGGWTVIMASSSAIRDGGRLPNVKLQVLPFATGRMRNGRFVRDPQIRRPEDPDWSSRRMPGGCSEKDEDIHNPLHIRPIAGECAVAG